MHNMGLWQTRAQVCADPGDRSQRHLSHAAVGADSAGLSVGAVVLVWVPLCIMMSPFGAVAEGERLGLDICVLILR